MHFFKSTNSEFTIIIIEAVLMDPEPYARVNH